MPAPDSISSLVRHFQSNLEDYRNPHYNETQLRQEFINPFFTALGWDVNNTAGAAEAYKPVVHEDAVKVSGATKAPDYSFRIGGTRKFFVETKKPAVKIAENAEAAFQLRRYGWSAKLALSILADFDEFAVYDCRVKPAHTDKASAARIMLLSYTDYLTRWEELCNIFSPEAILRGSFDRFAESEKLKKGTARVDDAFLSEIERWRDELARSIAVRNPSLSVRELNFAVQRIIDRIVFLRICEDRGVEEYGRLQALLNGGRVYPRLVELFLEADQRYNSGLFHFRPEKDRPEPPDELTTGLEIDDKALKDILKNLYYPDSPYEFSVFSADILGQVYEQFLGKVIRLTAGHHAVVENKPEVKKAGGVYYTPVYIVEYIVKNTVGKLLSGKTLRAMKQSPIRILDPACGSGSFLIQAYQYLLDWYGDKYAADGAQKHGKEVYRGAAGVWRLSTSERKRILLAHIFGVDIDPQAVEVTKLSLLLKVLEGETYETLNRQMAMFHERALPDLAGNIKCGNSLIGSDYFAGRALEIAPPGRGSDENMDDEYRRINPFDWDKEFAEIMGAGGFDAVIGNPPYGATLTKNIKDYLSNKFPYVADYETSQYFINLADKIIRKRGYTSFIVPNTLVMNVLAKKFRQFLAKSFSILEIANLSRVDVFVGATVRTIIPILYKDGSSSNEVTFIEFENETTKRINTKVFQKELIEDDNFWHINLSESGTKSIMEKIQLKAIHLGDILEVSQGLIPYDKYRGHDEKTIKNRIWHFSSKKDNTYKKELRGGDVKRYYLEWNGKQWISYGPWLAAPRKAEFFTNPRILFREITDTRTGLLHVTYTEKEFYNNPGIINCISRGKKYSLFYILGIANSKLIAFYHYGSSPKARKGVFPKILVKDVRNLPIRTINFSDPADVARHDHMVSLVETMLSLHKKLPAARTPDEKIILQKQIDTTDRQIDALVYELYGLTEEEIGVVEGG